MDEQNDNYSTTSLTGGVENKTDTAIAEPWGDKYTEGDWRTTNDSTIDTIITTESTLSLASLTTTCSYGDSSNVLSSIDIMQVDMKRRLSGDNNDRDRPLRKRRKGSPISSTDREQYKFACPFRKYNPAKYGIQHRSGICALSQWDCISRLKYVMTGHPRECNWRGFKGNIFIGVIWHLSSVYDAVIRLKPQEILNRIPKDLWLAIQHQQYFQKG